MTDHDLDLLLADLNDEVPPMTDDAFASGRARLFAVAEPAVPLVSWSPTQEEHTGQHVRRGPPRRLAVLATAAAAVVAVTAGVLLVGDSRTVTAAAVASPEQLVTWAQGLADNPPVVGPNQYRYVRSEHTYERDADDVRFRVISSLTSEMWIPYDYKDEWRFAHGPVENDLIKGTEEEAAAAGVRLDGIFVGPGGTARCGDFEFYGNHTQVVPRPDPCDGDGWTGAGSPQWFHDWSDPQKLWDELHRQAVDRGPGLGPEIFVQARDNLLNANWTNEFKSALYQALSRTPGLVVLDDAKTTDGRSGIGLRVSENGTTEQWVLDRETGDYLELRETTGEFSDSITTYTYGVTDDMNTTPAAR
jgi:hypothetical protein